MENLFKLSSFISILICLQNLSQINTLAESKIQWVSSQNVNFTLLEFAGKENVSEGYIYVARGRYMSAMIPGKFFTRTDSITIAYKEEEIIPDYFEFLEFPAGTVSFVPITASSSVKPDPRILVYGGIDPISMETLFVCRVLDDDFLVPGYYSFTNNYCEYSIYGSVAKNNTFEFLAQNNFGKILDVGRGNYNKLDFKL